MLDKKQDYTKSKAIVNIVSQKQGNSSSSLGVKACESPDTRNIKTIAFWLATKSV